MEGGYLTCGQAVTRCLIKRESPVDRETCKVRGFVFSFVYSLYSLFFSIPYSYKFFFISFFHFSLLPPFRFLSLSIRFIFPNPLFFVFPLRFSSLLSLSSSFCFVSFISFRLPAPCPRLPECLCLCVQVSLSFSDPLFPPHVCLYRRSNCGGLTFPTTA